MFADGILSPISNTLRVNLQASDASHLQCLLSDLDATLHQVKYKVISGHNVAGIALTSLYLRLDLAAWGMTAPKKERRLPQIPQQFTHHFIRGYFDGDGSISVNRTVKREQWKVSIAALSHIMLEQIAQALSKAHIPCSIYNPTNTNIWYLAVGGNQVKRFGQWLYADASRSMARKMERFEQIA